MDRLSYLPAGDRQVSPGIDGQGYPPVKGGCTGRGEQYHGRAPADPAPGFNSCKPVPQGHYRFVERRTWLSWPGPDRCPEYVRSLRNREPCGKVYSCRGGSPAPSIRCRADCEGTDIGDPIKGIG